jgi:hypothetical protein
VTVTSSATAVSLLNNSRKSRPASSPVPTIRYEPTRSTSLGNARADSPSMRGVPATAVVSQSRYMRKASSMRLPGNGATQRWAMSTPSRPNTASTSAWASALLIPFMSLAPPTSTPSPSPLPQLYSVMAIFAPGSQASRQARMRGR